MDKQQVNELLKSDYTKDFPENPPQKTGIDVSLYMERIRESDQRLDSIRHRLKAIYLNLHHVNLILNRIYAIADDHIDGDGSAICALAEMGEDATDDLKIKVLSLVSESNYHPVNLDPFVKDGDELEL